SIKSMGSSNCRVSQGGYFSRWARSSTVRIVGTCSMLVREEKSQCAQAKQPGIKSIHGASIIISELRSPNPTKRHFSAFRMDREKAEKFAGRQRKSTDVQSTRIEQLD